MANRVRTIGQLPRVAVLVMACLFLILNGCVNATFNVPEGTLNEAEYVALFPYYAEFCAVSEIDKKPGFGAEIVPGGHGGHSILYLNGVCRVKDAGYPVVSLCGPDNPKP